MGIHRRYIPLFVVGLAAISLSSCCSSVMATASSTANSGSGSATVDFEAILLRRLHLINKPGANATGVAEVDVPQIVQTIGELFAAPYTLNETFDKVPELHHDAFWDVVQRARTLAGLDAGAVEQPLEDMTAHVDAITRSLAHLPDHLCWPVLRRIVVGALLQRRLQVGDAFRTGEQAAVVRLCVRLFATHRAGAGRKGVIDFFHISKAGGTTFCQLAKLNGCRTQSFAARRNCLIREFDDVPRWVSNALHVSLAPRGLRTPWFANWGAKSRNPVSCHIRKRYMARRRYNIAANEFTLYGGARVPRNAHVCPGNLNVVQLRHPHLRLRSHLMWVWALYDHHFKEQAPAFFPNHGSSHWRVLMPAATDNYYIRSLLGEAVYFLPAENLTRTHLAAARLALTQFDVLLLLEQPAMNEVLYEMAIGWGLGFGAVHARTSSTVHEVGRQGLPDPDDWAALLARNELDLELYRFGSLLALLDAIVFDVARAAGLGSGYSAVAGGAEEQQEQGGGSSGGEGGGAGVGGAVVSGPRAVNPGDDEQWELAGLGENGTAAARRASCGFVAMNEADVVLPAWVVV